MLRTVYIKYREPLTQIWVEGKEEMYFRNEEEMQRDLDDWELYFSRLYGADFEMTVCDWGHE